MVQPTLRIYKCCFLTHLHPEENSAAKGSLVTVKIVCTASAKNSLVIGFPSINPTYSSDIWVATFISVGFGCPSLYKFISLDGTADFKNLQMLFLNSSPARFPSLFKGGKGELQIKFLEKIMYF